MKDSRPEKFYKVKPSGLEKPPFLYHGSITAGIKELKPHKRHTPYEEAGERIYATHLPAFAAAHSFDWSSSEGFDTPVRDGKVTLVVPIKLKDRLNVPVYMYKVPSDSFNFTSKEGTGNTFDSTEKVPVINVEKFNSVTEAVEYFGGKVIFKD